jgi:hypothetical protein
VWQGCIIFPKVKAIDRVPQQMVKKCNGRNKGVKKAPEQVPGLLAVVS